MQFFYFEGTCGATNNPLYSKIWSEIEINSIYTILNIVKIQTLHEKLKLDRV